MNNDPISHFIRLHLLCKFIAHSALLQKLIITTIHPLPPPYIFFQAALKYLKYSQNAVLASRIE